MGAKLFRRSPWRRTGGKRPLEQYLAISISAVLLTTLASIGLYTYFNAIGLVGQLSSTVLAQTTAQVQQRVVVLLQKAENQSRLLAGLLSPGRTPSRRNLSSASFERLGLEMIELLRANPEFSYLSVTLDATGEVVQVRQETNGSLVLTRVVATAAGLQRQEYVPFGDDLIRIGEPSAWREDARRQSTYLQAVAASGQVWTGTHVISSPGGRRVPGVTCATPVLGAGGRLVAVVTVDLTLNDLSRFIQTIQFGRTGYAFLAEIRTGSSATVVAHPRTTWLVPAGGGKQRLATLEELDDRAAQRLVKIVSTDLSRLRSTQVRQTTFSMEGRRYTAGFARVAPRPYPDWVLFTLAPTEEFMGGIRQAGVVMSIFAGLALVLGVAVSLWISARIASPLSGLQRETARIRRLDLDERPWPESPVQEVDALVQDMARMKTGLRSFAKLVPREYVEWLLRTGHEARLGGERREITVSFADVVGFTRLSEHMPPEHLLETLADYFEVLSRAILEAEGTIDKFNGDDVMAFWGAPRANPRHALSACRAVLQSHTRLVALRESARELGKPELEVCFGIETGEVVVGNVGSHDRMNYTVIGDAANIASRLQGLNKLYGTRILIGPQTHRATLDELLTRPVDWVQVVGRERPILAHELLGLRSEASPEERRLAEDHAEAMRLYRLRRWHEALEILEALRAMKPSDIAVAILTKRCMEYMVQPPGKDWDGSIRIWEK